MENIKFNKDARKSIKKGIDTVADAVKITIGPYGRNAALYDSLFQPIVTNDGVSISRSIILEDPFEDIGAAFIKEVGEKTNEQAGDGTTTSMVLTQKLVDIGLKKVENIFFNINVIDFKKGMEASVLEVTKKLKERARSIDSFSDLKNIATISAESEDMGFIVASAVDIVGADGVVTVEESQEEGLNYKIIDGLTFESGYVSPYMVNDTQKMQAVYTDVHCLCYMGMLNNVKDILPLVEKMMKEKKNELVIFSMGADGEALASLIVNNKKGTFKSLVIKAPGYFDADDRLEDIAYYTGATLIDDDLGTSLKDAQVSDLGHIEKIIASKNKTTIICKENTKTTERIEELKALKETTTDKLQQQRYQNRIASLSGQIGIVSVGASTEKQMNYLKLKLEDTINATQAALQEGIVRGGGLELLNIGKDIKNKYPNGSLSFIQGWKTVAEACEAPHKQICKNAGGKLDIPDEVIDPVKVTRCAITNAVSATATLLTTDVAVILKK